MDILDTFTGEPEEPEQEEPKSRLVIKKKPIRSERLQLLVTPDLLKAINGFINAVIEAYLNQ